ncbi:MAG: hypothetical protein AB7V13_06010 [Pseudorhodoplanes sp.]|uniref:hypothetical protein n=1 Tax=Pseudorhodoplanes sp. TaxID=1934341 RepID=UPI003D0FE80A
MNSVRSLVDRIQGLLYRVQGLIDSVDWHRLRWFGVLAISIGFTVAGSFLIVATGEPMAFVCFFFFLFGIAMAVHALWPWWIEGLPTSPEAALQRFPHPVTLRTPVRKIVFFLVTTILFGGCLLWMALYSDMGAAELFFMWLGAIGCAAALPIFLLMLLRGSALRLDADGFRILHGLKRSVHRWSDMSEFSVVDVGMPMVVFDEAGLTDGAVGSLNRSFVGRGGGLPDTYGMSAWSLAWLLNEWRARALAIGPPPGPQSLPAP